MNFKFDSLPKDKNQILNFAILIAAFIIALLVFNNFSKDVASLNRQKEEEAKKSDLSQKIVAWEKDAAPYKEFLNKKNMDKIINTINNKAIAAGARVVSFKPLPEANYVNYVSYPFEINLTADSYKAVGRLVSSLENSPEVFIVEGIDIGGRAQQRGGSGFQNEASRKEGLSVNLKINTVTAK